VRRIRLSWLLDNPWIAVVVVLAVGITWWAIGTRRQPHHVWASFSSAMNLSPGQAVQVDGVEAGKIGKVKYEDGHAIVQLGINDSYWPLHAGTTVKSRWGTTIGSGTRRVDLSPGPTSAPVIREGGVIESRDTTPAVDVDQVLNTLTHRTRAHLQDLQGSLDATLTPSTGALNRDLRVAPRASRRPGE